MTDKPKTLLLLSDARGIYIPRDFTLHVGRDYVSGISDEDWEILAAGPDGPDHEHYWDTWEHVLNNAEVTSDEGVKYFLNQEGDLWLIPKGMEWDDEADGWRWP
jgi:hypothetical protein